MARPQIIDNGKITINAFSQLAGCDKTTVERAIKLGHLEDAVTRNPQGHIRIDPEKGRANWARNWADTANATPRLREWLRSAAKPTAILTQQVKIQAHDWKNLSVAESRRIREAHKAENEFITLQSRLGKLVDIDEVRAAQFEVVQIFRRDFEVLPTKLGPQFGLTHEQVQTWQKETEKILVTLSALTDEDFTVRKR